jgi:hypothetical protein
MYKTRKQRAIEEAEGKFTGIEHRKCLDAANDPAKVRLIADIRGKKDQSVRHALISQRKWLNKEPYRSIILGLNN